MFFEFVVCCMSVDVVSFVVGNSSVSKGESLCDIIEVLIVYKVDVYVVCYYVVGVVYLVVKYSGKFVINVGDGWWVYFM